MNTILSDILILLIALFALMVAHPWGTLFVCIVVWIVNKLMKARRKL